MDLDHRGALKRFHTLSSLPKKILGSKSYELTSASSKKLPPPNLGLLEMHPLIMGICFFTPKA